MIKDDEIFQLILKYDYNLFRGEKGITQFIENHLTNYCRDLKIAVEGKNQFIGQPIVDRIKEKVNLVEETCSRVVDILKLYDKGNITEAYCKNSALFEDIKDFFIFTIFQPGNIFTRIREGDHRILDNDSSKKSELFHIKWGMRERIGAYRYSIPGYPCLYLADSNELAWLECGMPHKFSYCNVIIAPELSSGLKVIDFSNKPFDFLSNVSNWLLNDRRQNREISNVIIDMLIKYIVTYPIAAACTVKVKNRGAKFIEEYIFPQMLMQAILEKSDIDGVRYMSALRTTLVDGMFATNIAFVVRKLRPDGLDRRLCEILKVSDIGYIDLAEIFAKNQSKINDLKILYKELICFVNEEHVEGEYPISLMKIIEYLIRIYESIEDNEFINVDLLFRSFEQITEHIDLIFERKEKMIDAYRNSHYQLSSDALNQVEECINRFKTITGELAHRNQVFFLNFESLSNFEKL